MRRTNREIAIMIETTRISLGLAAVFALSGCAGMRPTPVKDILAQPGAYLDKNFTMAAARPEVSNSIGAVDHQSLSFHKVVLKMKVEQQFGAKDVNRPEVFDTETYVNLGGPYVQRIAEGISNQLSVSQTYMLSYRGLLSLRWQDVRLGATYAAPIDEIKSFKNVPAWPASGPGSGGFDYEYQWAPTFQIANYLDRREHCDFGKIVDAASINPKLRGQAQMLDCQDMNANGV